MNKLTGGSAFPTQNIVCDSDGRITGFPVDAEGMTLRDYFAAKAMQALIAASGDAAGSVDYNDDAVAKFAYLMADVMLKARQA